MTGRLRVVLVFVAGVAVGLGFALGLAWPVAHAQSLQAEKTATRTSTEGDGPKHHYVRTRLARVFSADRAHAESVAECITYGDALSCRWK